MLLLLMSDREKPQFINIISIINIVNSVCIYLCVPFFFYTGDIRQNLMNLTAADQGQGHQ